MELEVMGPKQNNDERDMARLGKSPVLKVKGELFPHAIRLILILTTLVAEFRLHVNSGLQLHDSHHLGGLFNVRHYCNTPSETVALIQPRVFDQGFAK